MTLTIEDPRDLRVIEFAGQLADQIDDLLRRGAGLGGITDTKPDDVAIGDRALAVG